MTATGKVEGSGKSSAASTSQTNHDLTESVSRNTFIRNVMDEDSNDVAKLLQDEDSKKKTSRRRNRKPSESLPAMILQKRLITLRSTLLALSLALTLLSFWLVDSLKDPTFAALVDGNLKRHQPLAKIASVGGTLALVMLMEVISHERKKRRRNLRNMDIMSADDVQSGGGVWTRMDIGSEIDVIDDDLDDDLSGDQIPVTVFRGVGFAYIAAFAFISFLLRRFHRFSGDEDDNGSGMEQKSSVAWHILGYIQYVTIESYGSVAVATFWSFTNSTLTLKAAKTYYGFIIAMAQLGAIGGSTLATTAISIPNMFLLACVGIGLQVWLMGLYGNRFPHAMDEEDDAAITTNDGGNDLEEEFNAKAKKARREKRQYGPQEEVGEGTRPNSTRYMSGVHLILKYNYLLLILGVSCLYEVSLTCLDYEMKLIGLDRFRAPPDLLEDSSVVDPSMSEEAASAFATFMGRYGQLTNLLSLILSYYAFPYLMDNYGLKFTLRIFPSLLVAITVMTFVALPMNLPVLFISMSLLKALTYSINDPSKEILYIPTGNTVKFKAKFWIDVVGARIAKAVGSSINTYAGTAERIVQYGSLPSVVTAVALWVICFAAGNEFDSLLKSGTVVGIEEDEIVEAAPLYYDNMDDDSYDDEDTQVRPSSSMDESLSGWESNATIEFVSRKSA